MRRNIIRIAEDLSRTRPRLREFLVEADRSVDRAQERLARVVTNFIQPQPRSLFISITANCNFACKGCHYGREFMPGKQLPLHIVRKLLTDAKAAGFSRVRFYGGEPLVHRDLPRMIEYARELGLNFWITTNGLLLKRRIDELFDAGARDISLGYYGGSPEEYNTYVQRKGAHEKVERGVAYLRDRYGDRIHLHLDWVLMRPTASISAIGDLWRFASKYRTPIGVNLVHYSLPYFLQPGQPGWEDCNLAFNEKDQDRLWVAVAELLRLRSTDPELLPQSPVTLKSIPDWLIKKEKMAVPCLSRRLIWVGADGTVQMCYVTFKLGNLHNNDLKEMLNTRLHKKAAIDAHLLNCPNCNCGFDSRVLAHGPSHAKYRALSIPGSG